jgi:hypothetical protein
MLMALMLSEAWRLKGAGQTFSVVMGLCLVAVTVLGVDNLYTGRYNGYRHDQTRAVNEAWQSALTPADGLVVVDHYDNTVLYYDRGDIPLFRAGFDQGFHTPADLLDFIKGKAGIAVLRFHAERSDKRDIIPFYLERYGRYLRTEGFEGYSLEFYGLDPASKPELLSWEGADLRWETLKLRGWDVDSGDSLTLALRWETAPDFPADRDLAARVTLIDPLTGWRLGAAESVLIADDGDTSKGWAAGEEVQQYLVIPLWPGTPPLTADLEITLFDALTGEALTALDENNAPRGQTHLLTSVRLGRPGLDWPYPFQPFTFTPLEAGPLQGFSLDWPAVNPGGTLSLTLNWLESPETVLESEVIIRLVQGDQVIALEEGPPLQGRTPAPVPPGYPWLDRRILRVDQNAGTGPAQLELLINGEIVRLGTVEVEGFPRLMTPPEIAIPYDVMLGDFIRLVGYEWLAPRPLASSDVPLLKLVWQAVKDIPPGTDLKVFVHLLAEDGRVVAQHDSYPAGNTRPLNTWIAGEYIIDEHPITFLEAYSGGISLQFGLYDPVTFERLLTPEGQDVVRPPLQSEDQSVHP